MDFALTSEQEELRGSIAKLCRRFDDAYWLEKDKTGGFPTDFHRAFAKDGWLAICIPEAYGGAGLGITEAAIMMRAVAGSVAGMSGCSAIHINVFGLNPIVVFGSEEQKARMLPPLAQNWMELEAAWLMVMSAAWYYDKGLPSGAPANAAKYLAGEAGFNACQQAIMTHGGYGYAKEFHVERYLREVMIPRIAPVSPQLVMCFIAEKVLGLPRSY